MLETRFHQRSALYVGLLYFKSYVGGQTFFRWSAVEVWREVPAQVLSSSSDHGSKLRGPSQNSPRVASKRDVNITQMTQLVGILYEAESEIPLLEIVTALFLEWRRNGANEDLTPQDIMAMHLQYRRVTCGREVFHAQQVIMNELADAMLCWTRQ
ncbi:hypothetical protein AVEN_249524-1, partial [Araneus ventricosus]